uniref:Uncharacterized protein n=1 Tax=viral metagenome TaxID=1070528 RepID=A0A6C0IJ91_9ZZZZ
MERPSHFKDLNNELTQRYNIIIAEIVKTYPSYKANNNYEDGYKKNINNLEKLQGELFLLKNNLNKSTDELQKDIKEIDDKIYNLEEENVKLRGELALLTNSDNAAHGRLTDAKTMYNQKLLGNWLLFFSLTSVSYLLYRK